MASICLKDPTLLKRYGVCVEKCPKQFEVITDYAGTGGTPLKRPQDLSWHPGITLQQATSAVDSGKSRVALGRVYEMSFGRCSHV